MTRKLPITTLLVGLVTSGCAWIEVPHYHASATNPMRILAVSDKPTWIAVRGNRDVLLFGDLFERPNADVSQRVSCLYSSGNDAFRAQPPAPELGKTLLRCPATLELKPQGSTPGYGGRLVAVLVRADQTDQGAYEGTVCISPCNRPTAKSQWRDIVVVGLSEQSSKAAPPPAEPKTPGGEATGTKTEGQ